MKNDALKKHHFWILFGAAAVFIPLAFLLMWLIVSGEVSAKNAEYQKQLDDLKVDPKTVGQLKGLEQRKDALSEQKDKLHLSNYERQEQAGVFEWPTGNDPNLKTHNEKKYKFGDKLRRIETEFEQQVLGPVFEQEYKKFANDLLPTHFTGGTWRSALRYVSNWGRGQADPDLLWLALEDYWVQKAVLRTLTKVNEDAALFTDVTPKDAATPLKRKFRNHVWELDLEVTQKGNVQVMAGTLKNLTDRLQVLGMDKSMRVKVWLDNPNAEVDDFEFLIQGEMVPGKKEVKCEPREIRNVPAVTKIAKVKQEFDEATVPVRLINTIELGFLDHKNKSVALQMPKHLEDAAASDPAAATPGDATMPGEGGALAPGAPISMGGLPGMPGMYGGPGGAGGTGRGKTGGPKAVLGGNKARYLTRTEDVRRMPVALSIVVDRDFVNDVLVAYANSPLRFQTTQMQWQRYRGAGYTGESSVGAPGGVSAPGETGSPDAGGDPGPGPGARGDGKPGLSMGGLGGPGGPGGLFGGLGGGAPGGVLSNSGPTTPPEANAGLVELDIYGVVSLYEKKVAKVAKPANPVTTPEQPTAPAGTQPKDPAAPGDAKPAGGEQPKPPAGEQPKPTTPGDAKPTDPAKDPKGEAQTPPNK